MKKLLISLLFLTSCRNEIIQDVSMVGDNEKQIFALEYEIEHFSDTVKSKNPFEVKSLYKLQTVISQEDYKKVDIGTAKYINDKKCERLREANTYLDSLLTTRNKTCK